MRVLVTGGGGFIGSHLVDRLLADGCEVVVLDDLSTGRQQNLAHHEANPKLIFQQAGISDFEACRPLFDGVEWVFHLAGRADIVPSIQTWSEPAAPRTSRSTTGGTVSSPSMRASSYAAHS